VQPAEMAKLATVLYLAMYVTRKEGRMAELVSGFLPPLVVVGLFGGLILMQPDLGTVLVLGTVTLGVLFLGGARLKHLCGLIPIALILLIVAIWKSPYRLQRLMSFLDPGKDPTGVAFQVNQSFLAFGSGKVFGVGLGEGKQKLFFLPEAHTDFVLALVGEELGLIGTALIIILFSVLAFKGFQIAGRAREPFGRYLALGITLLIGVQVLVNAGVATGLLPTKGLTLPLVSYGGSSLLMTLLSIGILLSISRDRQGGRKIGGYRIGGGMR
jgi:cell division protein FtsW